MHVAVLDGMAVHESKKIWQEILPEFWDCSSGVMHGNFYIV